MALANEFLLERVVHHVLKADPHGGREALLGGWGSLTAPLLIAEVLWPAMECVEQLRADELISTRTYNGAIRTLRGLLELLERRLSREAPNGRSVLVLTAAGERGDFGADILATLAEAHGWMVIFAGAGLSMQEILYSLGQLRPDAILLQGRSMQGQQQLQRLRAAMESDGLYPAIQIAAAGAVTMKQHGPAVADLTARGPLEILELLALWPEHRSEGREEAGLAFSAAVADPVGLDHETIRRMILRHLRSGAEGRN